MSLIQASNNLGDLETMSSHALAGLRAIQSTYALAASPAQPAPEPAEVENLRKALQFYADGDHFIKSDDSAWDTVSGEPQNYWCDEAGTATVEDGSIAKLALAGHRVDLEDEAPAPAATVAGLVLVGYINRGIEYHTKGKTVFHEEPTQNLEVRWWTPDEPVYTLSK